MEPIDPTSIHHAPDDDLQLYILGRLSAAQVDVLEHHLSDCLECKDRLASTARFVARIVALKRDGPHSDKRAHPRFRTTDTGFLRCLAPLLPQRWRIQIVDVSGNGLGLLVPTRLSVGALVQVHIGDTFVLGDVRYCTQIGENQFRTGVRIQDLVKTQK